MDHVETCIDIGEKAAKEYNIEVMMNEMKEFWAEKNFLLLDYKEGKGGYQIIRGYDEI